MKQTDPPPSVSAQANIKKWLLVGIVIVSVVYVGAVGVFSFLLKNNESTNYLYGDFEVLTQDTSTTYTFRPFNFVFSIPSVWYMTATSSIHNAPITITDPHFVFKSSSENCILVFSKKIDWETLGSDFKQVTYFTQVSSRDGTINLERTIDAKQAPLGFEFSSDETKAFIASEFVIASFIVGPDADGQFILFADNGGTLSASCFEDLKNTVKTFTIQYPTATITEKTDGLVSFLYRNLQGTDKARQGPILSLVLKENNVPGFSEVMNFPGTTSINPRFIDNVLYAVDEKGRLIKIDIFNKQKELVPILLKEGEFVSDYLIDGSEIYYFAGPFCNYYRAKCENTLRTFNMERGTTEEHVSHISERSISGFDPKHMYLYFSYEWGDAGCNVTKVTRIHLATKTYEKYRDFQSCDDDPDYEAIGQEVRSLSDSLTSPGIVPVCLELKNGFITPANKETCAE